MPIKPTVHSLSLVIAFDEGLDVGSTGVPPAMRILATLSNHYGEWGSEAAFLHKAQQIVQVLEREGDPFPVRVFARQDADDVMDASDPDEWQEVFAQAEAKPDEVLHPRTSCNSMQIAIARVLDCSKAFYADEAMDSPVSICP